MSERATRARRVRRIAIVAYSVLALAFIAVLVIAGAAAFRATHEFVIEADTAEPAIVEIQQTLTRALESEGFTVRAYDIGDEDIVVERVQDTMDQRGVDLGITARSVSPRQFPDVVSLGVIAKVPLLLVARGPEGTYTSPAELRGKRIQIGDYASVSADLAQRLLAAYGVTPENSTLQRDVPEVAQEMLAAGESDAVFSLFIPRGKRADALKSLVATGEYSLVPMPSTKALAGELSFVDVGTVPRGTLGLAADVPSADMNAIFVPITVVAHKSLSTSAVFAMAQGLKEDFAQGDALSSPGEFPELSYNLPNNLEAASYYETSSMPWQYHALPPALADLFIPLALAGTIFLIAASVYSLLLPEFYSLWTGVLRPRRERRREHRHTRRSARAERTGSADSAS